MQGLRNMLLQEQKHLQEIADKARMGMSVEPEGHLRISRDKNKPRYYQCIDGNNEIYIPRSNKELPKLLAQRTYNRTVLKKVEARLKQIGKILQDYTDDEIEKIYTSMHKERQLLVTPIEPTWNQLLMKWYEEEYHVRHFLTKDQKDISAFRQSKYVYSETENIYGQIKGAAEEKRKVLFISLPCKVAGLYSFLGDKLAENLLTVDIVCHGTPPYAQLKEHIKK